MIEAQRNASFLTRLGWRLEATAWDAYAAWYRAKGIDKASDAAGDLLRKLGPLMPTHTVARINMQRCFPEAADAEIDRLLGAMWENFGRLAGEMPHLDVFAGPEFNERVEFIGRERLEQARDTGQPLVIISTHSANWEIAAAAISQTGLPCHITYRPANNVLIDERISRMRQGYGVKTLTAKGGDGAKQLMQALKAGESVALMNDQKMNDGVEAPFFGHPAMTAPGPTRLAMRYGCPLQPLSVRRLGGARFRVEAHEPIELSTNPDKTAAIVETVTRINQWVESEIRKAPEQWFWVHRRWAKAVYKG
ncbi:lysophospholipid acyltransferase family protein [Maricaulis parjimensis]|uniref:lysophospholipid acyltransferase family protein n=1 Tax=Maricaulis parjimensis TaxID=144023 RepID=UPI00193A4A94|nr:lysophospholipid acyltransferase family protein [Maricaulis parjimensis]